MRNEMSFPYKFSITQPEFDSKQTLSQMLDDLVVKLRETKLVKVVWEKTDSMSLLRVFASSADEDDDEAVYYSNQFPINDIATLEKCVIALTKLLEQVNVQSVIHAYYWRVLGVGWVFHPSTNWPNTKEIIILKSRDNGEGKEDLLRFPATNAGILDLIDRVEREEVTQLLCNILPLFAQTQASVHRLEDGGYMIMWPNERPIAIRPNQIEELRHAVDNAKQRRTKQKSTHKARLIR